MTMAADGMRLGIVGGGGAATSLLAALTHESLPDIDITLFETAKSIGPGRAYAPDSDSALLNVPAGRMSLLPDTPDDFVRWVNKRAGHERHSFRPAGAQDFLPRRLFGDYLAAQTADIADRMARHGKPMRIVDSRVTRAVTGRDSISLRTECGQQFGDLDRIVLCAGTGGPVDVYGLEGHEGYMPDPYPLWDRLAIVPNGAHVVVLGTGLTAVDTALFLLENGHKGRITMASRSGLLPAVRTSTVAPPSRYASRAAMRAALAADPVMTCVRLMEVLRAELHEAGAELAQAAADADPDEPFARRLDRQLRQARDGSGVWQAVIVRATLESIEQIWHAMPAEERQLFVSTWHQRFHSLLSPMPPRTATRLLAAARVGQLEVRRGIRGVRGLEMAPSSFLASTDAGEVRADVVVNTVRPQAAAVPEKALQLVDSLIRSGTARMHRFGGLDVSPANNRLITASGLEERGMYALGHLTTGVHYYTSSMLMIGRRARVIASQLLGELPSWTA
ncbi:FAD/NAD(P)-binding protein [Streptomyces lydicus]